MLRKLFFLTLVALGTTLSAQSQRINVVDSDAMKQKATERTELVNETVELNKEQEASVYEAYMWVERQNEAMKQRYKNASPGDYEADVKYQYVNWDKHVNDVLQKVLTSSQMTKWVEALK